MDLIVESKVIRSFRSDKEIDVPLGAFNRATEKPSTLLCNRGRIEATLGVFLGIDW